MDLAGPIWMIKYWGSKENTRFNLLFLKNTQFLKANENIGSTFRIKIYTSIYILSYIKIKIYIIVCISSIKIIGLNFKHKRLKIDIFIHFKTAGVFQN